MRRKDYEREKIKRKRRKKITRAERKVSSETGYKTDERKEALLLLVSNPRSLRLPPQLLLLNPQRLLPRLERSQRVTLASSAWTVSGGRRGDDGLDVLRMSGDARDGRSAG
jgi:hypothetical protein